MFDMSSEQIWLVQCNVTCTAITLNGHKFSTFLHIPTKIQTTLTVTSHIIAKYVPETNMFLKCHIYTTHAH